MPVPVNKGMETEGICWAKTRILFNVNPLECVCTCVCACECVCVCVSLFLPCSLLSPHAPTPIPQTTQSAYFYVDCTHYTSLQKFYTASTDKTIIPPNHFLRKKKKQTKNKQINLNLEGWLPRPRAKKTANTWQTDNCRKGSIFSRKLTIWALGDPFAASSSRSSLARDTLCGRWSPNRCANATYSLALGWFSRAASSNNTKALKQDPEGYLTGSEKTGGGGKSTHSFNFYEARLTEICANQQSS